MSKKHRNRPRFNPPYTPPRQPSNPAQTSQISKPRFDPSALEKLPVSYQDPINLLEKYESIELLPLRKITYEKIEKVTGRPLICYVTKTSNVQGLPVHIDDSDLIGFRDLIATVQGDSIDVLIASNGGSAEAAERIVNLIRKRFTSARFIVPQNAYSAATLMCFAGNEIIMDSTSTLGPIDPQINGIPARAILRAFESVQKKLAEEGPKALTAYMPLLSKYDLHILEICKSAQDLSEELAKTWLSTHMFRCAPDDPRVKKLVDFFASYDIHKSHGRSIDRDKAKAEGLAVTNLESLDLAEPVRSLVSQFEMMFDKTPFFKLFENAHGVHWGRQSQNVTIQLPLGTMPIPAPQPGPPQSS